MTDKGHNKINLKSSDFWVLLDHTHTWNRGCWFNGKLNKLFFLHFFFIFVGKNEDLAKKFFSFLNASLQKNWYPGSVSNNLTHVLRLLISKRGHTPLLLPKSKRPPRTDNLDVVEAFATVTTTTPTILLVGPEAATTVHSKYIHTQPLTAMWRRRLLASAWRRLL